jgi:hypothetical protein
MSKLNRSEFKELLLEWNKNIISEKDFKSLSIPGWSEFSEEQEEIVKSVNFPAIMLNFPIPNNLLKTKPNKKLHKIFQNRFSIFPKNEESYSLIKNAIENFYKTVVLNPRTYKKSLQRDYEETISSGPAYNEENITFNPKEIVGKEIVLDNTDRLFKEKKDILTGKDEENNIPCFIYLTKLLSEDINMASGGLFKISELSKDVSSSFLKWLFHHDFYHSLEMYSSKVSGKQIRSLERPSLMGFMKSVDHFYYIKIKGLEDSLNSSDNYASVIPYILTKSQEEAKSFLEENYLSYDEYTKLNHQYFGLKSIDAFNREKEENIDKILTDLVEIKKRYNTILSSLKDYIIIASYEISGSETIEIEDLPSADDPSQSKYALVRFENISEDNLDRIIDHAIKTQNGNLLDSIITKNTVARKEGICSKKSQIKIINMDISNKAFAPVNDFVRSDQNINGKNYIIIDIVMFTKYQDVVELACEKYYNSYEIENGEFVKVFRKMVEEYWPQVDTSKFLEESLLKNYISIIIS